VRAAPSACKQDFGRVLRTGLQSGTIDHVPLIPAQAGIQIFLVSVAMLMALHVLSYFSRHRSAPIAAIGERPDLPVPCSTLEEDAGTRMPN
jgi:hypothetical protein